MYAYEWDRSSAYTDQERYQGGFQPIGSILLNRIWEAGVCCTIYYIACVS